MAAAKNYTITDLKKAFEAGAKHESTYVGGGNSVITKEFESFDDYKKTLKVEVKDGE